MRPSETKSLFRAASVWWRCAQYFVIASCGKMPRDNRCMYMAPCTEIIIIIIFI